MKILKLTTLSILFLSSFAFSSTQTEISHLLKFVSETQCQYERNGTMHTGKEAKNHIQKKYDYYEDDIKTTEDFIRLSATKSYFSGKHYKIVYGIIVGSGVGGGLVIDKKIVSGPNGVAGEWGHNQITHLIAKKEKFESTNLREGEIESFMSGLSLAKKYKQLYKNNLKTNEIFELYRKHDLDAENFIDNFKLNLAISLASIVNILDPDCFVFGGGVSNEIDFLNEVENIVRKYVTGSEYDGVFLKPKYGDASGVRGAARLGRKSIY